MSYILSNCHKGGICRNLKNIINTMRYAEYYNLELIIFWPKYIKVMGKQVNENSINITHAKNVELESIINFKKKNIIIND